VEQVADSVIEGLAAERFLILPHPEVAEYFRPAKPTITTAVPLPQLFVPRALPPCKGEVKSLIGHSADFLFTQ